MNECLIATFTELALLSLLDTKLNLLPTLIKAESTKQFIEECWHAEWSEIVKKALKHSKETFSDIKVIQTLSPRVSRSLLSIYVTEWN